MGNKLNYFRINSLDLLTNEGPEPQRREVKKRMVLHIGKPGEGAIQTAEPQGSVDITAEDVARAQELLKRPKAQLGLF